MKLSKIEFLIFNYLTPSRSPFRPRFSRCGVVYVLCVALVKVYYLQKNERKQYDYLYFYNLQLKRRQKEKMCFVHCTKQ